MPSARERACQVLSIPPENRIILSLDGGGIRGIMTLQLLKHLEKTAGIASHKLFDMVAGTSTGGIIAGLIALGKTAEEIEQLYVKLVEKVFKPRNRAASQFLNPPRYTKENYVKALLELVGDVTLKDACDLNGVDLLITAKDVAAGEETFFSYFVTNGNRRYTYESVLLRAAMEATMSAPTYFYPMERFVDGGVTAYNNPATAAIMEAVQYGPPRKYARGKLTMFSFGTGCRPQLIDLEDIANPKGPDVKFWLQWLLTEAGDDASDQQVYMLRSKKLFKKLDFRRFQLSLDRKTLSKMPDRNIKKLKGTKASWLRELTDKELKGIKLDNVDYFPVMRHIGLAACDFVTEEAERRGKKPYSFDLADTKRRDLLVTREGNIERIVAQMGSAKWLDDRKRHV